jgi:hypothetical protein
MGEEVLDELYEFVDASAQQRDKHRECQRLYRECVDCILSVPAAPTNAGIKLDNYPVAIVETRTT